MRSLHIVFIILLFSFSACQERKPSSELSKQQEAAIYYFLNSSLLSDTLSRILYKMPVDCRGIDSKKKLVYFVYPDSLLREKVLAKISLDSHQVEYSTCTSGNCEFGGLQGDLTGYKAFRMPLKNLKLDTNVVFKCHLQKDSVSFTFNELVRLFDTSLSYNTSKHVDFSKYYAEGMTVANIGAYISKGGKDLLMKKIVDKVTKPDDYVELKAQKLLDFVTQNIAYSYEDLWYKDEITKRAHEVLFSGEADCSGLSTLYASLLEEAKIPYCLFYFDHHINVGLRGDYLMSNKYYKAIKDTNYVMAETTVKNFSIGITTLANAEILNKVSFYQIPKQSPFMYEVNTYEPLKFVDIQYAVGE